MHYIVKMGVLILKNYVNWHSNCGNCVNQRIYGYQLLPGKLNAEADYLSCHSLAEYEEYDLKQCIFDKLVEYLNTPLEILDGIS